MEASFLPFIMQSSFQQISTSYFTMFQITNKGKCYVGTSLIRENVGRQGQGEKIHEDIQASTIFDLHTFTHLFRSYCTFWVRSMLSSIKSCMWHLEKGTLGALEFNLLFHFWMPTIA